MDEHTLIHKEYANPATQTTLVYNKGLREKTPHQYKVDWDRGGRENGRSKTTQPGAGLTGCQRYIHVKTYMWGSKARQLQPKQKRLP